MVTYIYICYTGKRLISHHWVYVGTLVVLTTCLLGCLMVFADVFSLWVFWCVWVQWYCFKLVSFAAFPVTCKCGFKSFIGDMVVFLPFLTIPSNEVIHTFENEFNFYVFERQRYPWSPWLSSGCLVSTRGLNPEWESYREWQEIY